ncbi:hypothetical protein U1Q18_024029 [Sarracenia purpurea var. burkii]
MGFSALLLLFTYPALVCGNAELRALMDINANLDPVNGLLTSWTVFGDPCDGSFDGLACNEKGQTANISLQGKGLSGTVSPVIAGLENLMGLYLPFNYLYGEIPKEISNLSELSEPTWIIL